MKNSKMKEKTNVECKKNLHIVDVTTKRNCMKSTAFTEPIKIETTEVPQHEFIAATTGCDALTTHEEFNSFNFLLSFFVQFNWISVFTSQGN